jgi:hypothetical protein
VTAESTHIFPTDLPAWLFFVQFLCYGITVISQANYNIAFDCPQAANLWSSGSACHGPNCNIEWNAGRRSTIIRQLSMVQITFEEDEV